MIVAADITKRESQAFMHLLLEAFNTIHETILKKILSRTLIKPQIYHQSTGNTRAEGKQVIQQHGG